MEPLFAILVGLLYAGGVYMLFRRSFIKIIIGLILLGHGSNLLIITSARLTRMEQGTSYPLVEAGSKTLPVGADGVALPYADPLPQALILTAIVISFAIVSYTIVLVKRTYQELGTDDLDAMVTTDRT